MLRQTDRPSFLEACVLHFFILPDPVYLPFSPIGWVFQEEDVVQSRQTLWMRR